MILTRTPFYGEGGGEVGDTGRIEWDGGFGQVRDTQKTKQGVFLHSVLVQEGELTEGATVRAVVAPSRAAIQRHHTATHLLHAALRAVLGEGVQQKGSLVAAERLRFDFSHGSAMTVDEIAQVEGLVSRWVSANFPVTWQEMPIAEAKAAGATALFGEKYGDRVRVPHVYDDFTTQRVLTMERIHATSIDDVAAVRAAGERQSLSAEHTVVGFFGATGSGKSALAARGRSIPTGSCPTVVAGGLTSPQRCGCCGRWTRHITAANRCSSR